MKNLPRVAIVGRPNVGKSTLFNRITRKRKAIVHETPGVTRDIQRCETDWNGVPFEVIDTGGLFSDQQDDPIVREVEGRAYREVIASDALIMVTDARAGLTPIDTSVANTLRNSSLPVFIAANKAERTVNAASEFFKLGFGNVYEISAQHGQGIGDLLDDIAAILPKRRMSEKTAELKVAVVGKPNVGKSSLINALIGVNANIVDERPGTTRDSIDLKVRWQGKDLVLVDTAGIKRRSKTKDPVTALSALKSIDAIAKADVAVLMLDASLPVSNQDVKVGSYAHKEGKGIMVCVNKWDLIEKDQSTAKTYEDNIRDAFAFLRYAPLLFISALTGQRTNRIFPSLWEIKEAREKRIPTSGLNKFLEGVISSYPPSYHGGGTGKIYYSTQTDISPPKFSMFVNNPSFFDRSYLRFLNNRLREEYSFPGTLIRIDLLGKKPKKG